MVTQKTTQLIRRLKDHSERSLLNWRPSTQEGVFKLVFDEYFLTVFSMPRAGVFGRTYCLSIYDSEGNALEQVCDRDLDETELGPEAFDLMKSIYDNARRKAMGVEKAIDDILGQLAMNEWPERILLESGRRYPTRDP